MFMEIIIFERIVGYRGRDTQFLPVLDLGQCRSAVCRCRGLTALLSNSVEYLGEDIGSSGVDFPHLLSEPSLLHVCRAPALVLAPTRTGILSSDSSEDR